MKFPHNVAFEQTVAQLMELYAGMTPLQASLVAIKAVKSHIRQSKTLR
jgi:hypothetical protein